MLDNDGLTCTSVCDVHNGGCGPFANCSLDDGEVVCSCPVGMVSTEDKKDCKGMTIIEVMSDYKFLLIWLSTNHSQSVCYRTR